MKISIINENNEIMAQEDDKTYVNEVKLVYNKAYEPGDRIVIDGMEKNEFYDIRLDDVLGYERVYMTTDTFCYDIPFGEKKVNMSPLTFSGEIHYLNVKALRQEENIYKNLAANVYDQHGDRGCFPHAYANVETRGEAVFAAKNAIDRVTENRSHGFWPYASWGINQDPNAELTVDFGREIVADKLVLFTRADFPHDNYWIKADVTFSDGTVMTVDMEKSTKPHIFTFEKKRFSWIKLSNLIKSDEPSPFPALSQIEVYGNEVDKKEV